MSVARSEAVIPFLDVFNSKNCAQGGHSLGTVDKKTSFKEWTIGDNYLILLMPGAGLEPAQ
jgi:hypothetical protein